jgi:hypothetical protein
MTLHLDNEADVVRAAAASGFWLTQRVLDNGQPTWLWLLHNDDQPQPSFLTRRQAIEYMSAKLSD